MDKDIRGSSCHSQSSTKLCEYSLPVIDFFQQPETSSQPLLSDVDDEIQAKITETNISPKGLV